MYSTVYALTQLLFVSYTATKSGTLDVATAGSISYCVQAPACTVLVLSAWMLVMTPLTVRLACLVKSSRKLAELDWGPDLETSMPETLRFDRQRWMSATYAFMGYPVNLLVLS